MKIIEYQEIKSIKTKKGRRGKDSKFEERSFITYSITYQRKQEEIDVAAKVDGIFPLVTNIEPSEQEPKKILEIYKTQPFLEKRFSTMKSILEVAPMFLKLPRRIEAMLFLYFVALMIISLMERRIRNSMKAAAEKATEKAAVEVEATTEKVTTIAIEKLPILPQGMKTGTPTWNNIRYFFRDVFFLSQENLDNKKDFLVKGLSKLHQKVLELLKIPLEAFNITSIYWWKFNPT